MKIIGLNITPNCIGMAHIEGYQGKIDTHKIQLAYIPAKNKHGREFISIIRNEVDYFVTKHKPNGIYVLDFNIAEYNMFGEFKETEIYYLYNMIASEIYDILEVSLEHISETKIAKLLKVDENQSIRDATMKILADKEKIPADMTKTDDENYFALTTFLELPVQRPEQNLIDTSKDCLFKIGYEFVMMTALAVALGGLWDTEWI